MAQERQITASVVDAGLLALPWDVPLEEWSEDVLAALPRGLSRHVVRFVRTSTGLVAVKEIGESVAYREYEVLRTLGRLEAPAVVPLAVVTGRTGADGEPLNSALVTRHLEYALPYRALFSQHMRPETIGRLIDALAVLLVRLHLLGFFWGDVSLSNTLFRRDAGAFAAYLVDAETGELHPPLSDAKRSYDLDLARTNIIGELMDLQAGEIAPEDIDTIEVGDQIVSRYESLWAELTRRESFSAGELWRVEQRMNRLNELGYDVDEIDITTDVSGTTVSIQPKVVDAGHFHRQVMRLTGLDVQENQGRRMLNDLEQFRATRGGPGDDLAVVAHDWLGEVFEPTVRAVPRELRRKLEPAEIFHEILEHRWYMSQAHGRDVPTSEAVQSYIETELRHRMDERRVIDTDNP
ncbi:DUF4032 domain-containing protein [Georgenia sp. Z1344]|uniref:DUF4032 domain-containing protein n=1 Tax=Georgenia sp. Z1344 TaxID=3416706 RepID=UPI003CE6AE57